MSYLMPILFAALGLLGGYLVNYLADVLPQRRKLAYPVCAHCGKDYPVKRYLLEFRGICPECKKPKKWRWVLTLVALSAYSLYTGYFPPDKLGFWLAWILAVYFSVIIVIDVEHRLILMPVIWVGFLLLGAIGLARHGWQSTLLGGVVGYGVMYGLYLLGELFSRAVAKRRGQPLDEVALGFGDVNLAGVVGLLLGFPGIAAGLMLAILLGGLGGGLVMLVMLLRKRYSAYMPIPYGPFIVLAAFFLMLQ